MTLVGRLAGRGLHLLGQVLLARWLGPAQFGLYSIAWALLRMLGFTTVLGLDSGVVRFASVARRSDPPGLKGAVVWSLRLSILAGCIVAAAVFLGASALATAFGKPELAPVFRWFAPAFLFFPLMQVGSAATRASERMAYSVLSRDLGQPVVNVLVIAAAWVLGWGLAGAAVAAVLSCVVAAGLAIVQAVRLFPVVLDPQVRIPSGPRELLAFSAPAMLGGMFSMYLVWADRLMVGYFRPEADVGLYQSATQFAILFAVVLTGLGTALSPMIARLHAAGDRQRLEELFRVSTKWGVLLSIPLLIIVVAAPRSALSVIFGSEYEPAWRALVILSLGQFVNVATGSINAMFMMTGYQRRWMVISGVTLAADVWLNWLLIPRWGIEGAAVATAVATTGMFLVGLQQLHKVLGITPYDARILKGLTAGVGAGLAVWAVSMAPLPSHLIALVVTTMVAAVVFGSLVLLFGIDDEDRMIFGLVRSRILGPSGGRGDD